MNIETNPKMLPAIPFPIPESYQKAIRENSSLLEQLFGVGSTATLETSIKSDKSRDPEVFKRLLHFLDVYIEIFDYSAKQQKHGLLVNPVIKGDSQVLQQCITKFREIWRQGFRGFQYLPEKKLEQVRKKAELEMLLKLDSLRDQNGEMKETLKQIMFLEQRWIQRINEHKRNKDLEVIQMEAVDKFKTAVAMEFPYLFDKDESGNNLRYCEDAYFEWKLEEMMKNCKNLFKADIPFREEEKEDILKSVLDKFTAKLEENVVKDLKSRNDSKKIVIREYMDNLVDKCVEKYKNSITTSVLGEDEEESTQVQMETETISQLHKKLMEESSPKFIVAENGIEIGTKEYQVKCLNTFNSRTYEIFSTLVKNLSENCQTNMIMCHQQTKVEIESCLEKVTEILGRYGGMISYSNVLRSQFENGLGSVFDQVKDVNRLNKEHLLTSTKPVPILTDEEIQYKQLMEKCKKTYTDKLLSTLKRSPKYPHSVDIPLLDECHLEAKSCAIAAIRGTNHNLLPPYLSSKLESKFSAYVIHFIKKAKEDLKTFMKSCILDGTTSIPFKALTGTDIETKNRSAYQVNTRYQCITAMKEYEDKSLEELRLEDMMPLRKIRDVLDQSVSYFEMYDDFRKSLNFSGSNSFCLTNKNFEFSFPASSSSSAFPGILGSHSSSANSLRKPKRAVRRFNK